MKMNLKSVLALVLAAVMLLGLCACGGDAGDADVDASVSPSPEMTEAVDTSLYTVRVDSTPYYNTPADEPLQGYLEGYMNSGTQVTALEFSGEFIKCALPTGIDAWVHSWFLEAADPVTERTRVANMLTLRMEDEDFEVMNAGTYTCMASLLNCRSTAYTGGIILTQLVFGDEVTVLGVNGDYYLCLLPDGNPVYCSKQYLSQAGTYAAVAGAQDLRVYMPGAEFDLKLTTANNPLGVALYPAVPLLEESTAEKLMLAYDIFTEAGYAVKIYDAYRPASAQQKLAATVPNAAGGGNMHSLGRAVDISLVDRATGKELKMPTEVFEYNELTARSSSASWEWAKTNNVNYLTEVMVSVGFQTIDNEWWHFENPGTTGLDTELDYDSLTYNPVGQYVAPAKPVAADPSPTPTMY